MRVEPSGQVNHDPAPQTPNGAASSPYRDALYSVGKTVGWGLFSCFSFVLRRAFFFIASYFPKSGVERAPISVSDLLVIPKLRELFEKDPFSVLLKILDLLNDDPTKAEKILVNLAHDCKEKPGEYSPYVKDVKKQYQQRRDWILKVDEVVKSCILSPKQQEIEEKALMGTFETDESYAVRRPEESFTEKARQFQKEYQVAQESKKKYSDLWTVLLAQFESDDMFNDLALGNNSPTVSAFSTEMATLTLGSFIERLLFKTDGSKYNDRKLTNLKQEKTFEYWANYMARILKFVLSEKVSPRIHLLSKQLLSVLENKGKRERFHQILCRVIDVFHPPG